MTSGTTAPDTLSLGLLHHRLIIEADAHPNLLMRLLEPLAVHDVMPSQIRVDASSAKGPDGEALIDVMRAEIAFSATAELADRLWSRIDVLVPVRNSHLVSRASSGADLAGVAA